MPDEVLTITTNAKPMEPKEIRRVIGQRLRDARLEAGLSQAEVQEVTGIPSVYISQYETGRRLPELSTLAILASELSADLTTILLEGIIWGRYTPRPRRQEGKA